MTIIAKVILDSINDEGNRLTTFQLRYPRYIHSEFMTHRVFSRNAASSRAIPIEKVISFVEDDKVTPIFMYNKSGMSPDEPMVGEDLVAAEYQWNLARTTAIARARELNKLGVHKQIANRILEPFNHIDVIATATELSNFFELRIHPAAQQEIQALALEMLRALDRSKPKYLSNLDWHTPFLTDLEEELSVNMRKKISVARCARVSYSNFSLSKSLLDDITLHDNLLKSKHMSPFEHIATPKSKENSVSNFRGWSQYRYFVERGL